ncbi:LysR family transcriptional regulator [Clostridium sp. MCC353]|uniref:LysR family transcriptional regulator n=1 Tax=Clostridium sp. MCC353 TaxID=2592646 RepID=UPI001C01EB3F|nr:LysR family transcriptional regulator [Clostridium sp. MCC353]MBT9776243.1 LysR family transcriptional regulator [Clostridium sp. MCC353]
MTSKELLYVKTVADEKSISQAAKKLFIAQPSLSQSLQRIEETLGTQLFNRTTSGLTLTFAGERYYHMATQILKMYEDFEIEISDINNLKTGRIHLGITNHLGTLTLSKVLPKFRNICSHVELIISEENSSTLEQLLLSGELDFAIMHAPKSNIQPQLHYDIMKKDPFVIAISPDHPLVKRAKKEPGYPYPVLDIKLLKNETFLMLHKQQRIRQVTDSVLAKAGIHQPKIGLTLRNYETAQLLAAQGLGITLVPLQYSQIAPSDYLPTILSIDEKYDASWDMSIATLKNSFLSKADQLFIQLVKEAFGGSRQG